MNANTLAIDLVRGATRITRDELEVAMEGKVLSAVIGATVSTLIRRGHLVESSDGFLSVGDESAIAAAETERGLRKAQRDAELPGKPELPPEVLAEATKPRELDRSTFITPKPGSVAHSNAIAHKMIKAVLDHGPLTAKQIQQHVPELKDGTLHYKCQTLVEKSQLLKRGLLYAVTSDQFDKAPALPMPPVAPDTTLASATAAISGAARPGSNPPAPKGPKPPPPPNPPPAPDSRIKSIADVARKHAAAAPEEHVLQIGDIYIAVTAPATVATRVLSAALAVLGTPA